MPRRRTPQSWNDLVTLAGDLDGCVFRGQASAAWELECSLHRALDARSYEEDADATEYFLLRAFQRGASRSLDRLPDPDDYLAWLSLMQHHGTPTRLLDFSYSFYVALYFAVTGARGDAALWAVDVEQVLRRSGIKRPEGRNGIRMEWPVLSNAAANEYLGNKLATPITAAEECKDLGVLPVEPFSQHPRMAAQQGLFLMPVNALLPIEENLGGRKSSGRNDLQKIIIPHALHETILLQLRNMNVTAATLFPGIDGFARSLLHTQLP